MERTAYLVARETCDHCKRPGPYVVVLAHEPKWDSVEETLDNGTRLCAGCIGKLQAHAAVLRRLNGGGVSKPAGAASKTPKKGAKKGAGAGASTGAAD